MAAHQHQCIGCGICEKVCPVSAIDVTERAMIDGRECINCGECEEICSEGAISSVRKRKEEDHEEGE
jgi:ferredoxin